jgi:hypothetical protein
MARTKKPHRPDNLYDSIHHYVGKLNNSKAFAGIVMILLNVGSKLIPVQIGGSAEEYMKQTLSKNILVFAMAWMGTRDIYTALGLTFIFIILSEYVFNDESSLCIIPNSYKSTNNSEAIKNRINTNISTSDEISSVIKSLETLKSRL